MTHGNGRELDICSRHGPSELIGATSDATTGLLVVNNCHIDPLLRIRGLPVREHVTDAVLWKWLGCGVFALSGTHQPMLACRHPSTTTQTRA